MAELLTPPPPRHALTPEQRDELLRLVAAVPRGATANHPAVIALREYPHSVGVPWWAPSGSVYLRIGDGLCADGRTNLEVGLDLMRRLAEVRDWGTR